MIVGLLCGSVGEEYRFCFAGINFDAPFSIVGEEHYLEFSENVVCNTHCTDVKRVAYSLVATFTQVY